MHLLVAKLRGYKQKSSLQNTHRRGYRYSVKVFELDFCHHVLVGFQGDFENITLLSLGEEEEHAFGLVSRRADEDHSSFRVVEIVSSTWNGATDVRLVTEIFVRQIVLGADENATGAVVTTRDGNQEVGVLKNKIKLKIYIFISKCLVIMKG